MGNNDPAGYCQSQPRTRTTARFLLVREPFEDTLPHIFRYARSCISYGNFNRLGIVISPAYSYCTTHRSVLDGIVQQIVKYLPLNFS